MKLGGIFDLDAKESRIQELERASATPGFWNDNQKANKVIQELRGLRAVAGP